MEEIFITFSAYVALGLEAVAVVVIAIGGIQAVLRLALPKKADPHYPLKSKKEAWVGLGTLKSMRNPQTASPPDWRSRQRQHRSSGVLSMENYGETIC